MDFARRALAADRPRGAIFGMSSTTNDDLAASARASYTELLARAEVLRYNDPAAAAELAREAVLGAETAEDRFWAELLVASSLSRIPEEVDAAQALLERVADLATDERMRCAALAELGENRALAGDFQAAVALLGQVRTLARLLDWRDREVAALSRLGAVRVARGQYREGLADLLLALRVRQGETQLSATQPPPHAVDDATAWELGTLYGRIGMCYSNLDDGERALLHYRTALSYFLPRFPQRAGRTLYRMGIAAEEHLQDLDAANRYYSESCVLLSAHGRSSGRGVALIGVGRVELERGKVEEAEATFVEAVETLEGDSHFRPFLADAIRSLGDARLELGRAGEALACFEQALPLFVEEHRPAAHMAGLHESFYRAHLALGDPASALRHHEMFHALQLKHSEERADWRMAELMVQFDTERALREREISRLRSMELEREVAERRDAEAALSRDRDELAERNRELHDLSIRDPLTGLFNRRYLDRRLEEAFSLASRREQPLSLMISDIDDFKGINDRFTHTVGDAVLKRIADLIRGHVRHSDVVARFGGEEFVVLFHSTELAEANNACEKLRALVESHDWHGIAEGLRVTLSIGLAALSDEAEAERLLLTADRRLYEAKAKGKNRVVSA
jgi:diguanylate cyclase (GGDEF)-like protein